MTTIATTSNAESAAVPRGSVTFADFARAFAEQPELHDDPSLAVRVLRETVLQGAALVETSAIDLFHAEAPLTGIDGWDALIAGAAVFSGAGRVSPGVLDWCAAPERWNAELFDPLGIGKYRLLEMLRPPPRSANGT